jgi:hypothetical protein
VRDLLGRWWQQHGAATQEQERRNAVLRQRALQRQAQAQSMAHEHIEKSSLQAPALPAHALAAIEAVCRDDEMVRRAWMGLCACQVDAKYEFTVHVLVLQVDPQPMRRADLDEDQLVQAYANDVALWLTQPDELVLVRVCFTTELALPPTLDASNARQWTRR